ncbi:MAG: hypothetical protein ACRCWF_14500 [Beijerinckiaceae bacterium]
MSADALSVPRRRQSVWHLTVTEAECPFLDAELFPSAFWAQLDVAD